MSTQELIRKLEKLDEHALLQEVTVRYLLSLPPALADAAFRGAILRWFDPPTLEAVLGAGVLSARAIPEADQPPSPPALYAQLCQLPFAEEFPGRGYCFHDLTRERLLAYLWEKEPDFYRQVSQRAAEHFMALLNQQAEQSAQEADAAQPPDLDLGVELAYHALIGHGDEAIDLVNELLNLLLRQRRLGTYHAVIQALSEHVEAGRLSPEARAWFQVWRMQEALENYDIAGLEKIAAEALDSSDPEAPEWLKAEAAYYLGHGLHLASRYAEAEGYLKQSIDRWQALGSHDGVLQAAVELGKLEYNRENFSAAGSYFVEALDFHVRELRIPASEESDFKDDTPLLVFTPEAWHRIELYPTDEEPDAAEPPSAAPPPEEASPDEAAEVPPQEYVLYAIDFDLEQMDIDPSELSEEALPHYQWPIEFDDFLAELWLHLGYTSSALDQYDLAAACARLAGQMYFDLDNLSGAQSAVQFLQSLGANLGDLEYVKNLSQMQTELLGAALSRKDPSAVLRGLIIQANAQLDDDDYAAARQTFEGALAMAEELGLVNEQATCLDGLARLCWIDEEYDQAVDDYRRALRLYQSIQNREGWADSMLSLGSLMQAGGRWDEAEQCFAQAQQVFDELRSFSGQFKSLLKRAEIAALRGDNAAALGRLLQSLQFARSGADTRLYSQAVALAHLADLHLARGLGDTAQGFYNEALEIAERIRNQQLWLSIVQDQANTLSEIAEYPAAVRVFDQALARDPNYTSAHSGKAWALEAQGKARAEEARQAYARLIELRPNNWWAHNGLARALKLSGDRPASDERYRWVMQQLQAEGVRPADRTTLAWCAYHLGEYTQAIAAYRQEVASPLASISSHFDLGLALLCDGQHPQALQAYRRGAEILQRRHPPLTRLSWLHVALADLQEALEDRPELAEAAATRQVQELLTTQQALARRPAPAVETAG